MLPTQRFINQVLRFSIYYVIHQFSSSFFDHSEKLKQWLGGKDPDDEKKTNPQLIEAFEDYSSDSRVKFIIKLSANQMKEAKKQGFHAYLSLSSGMSYTNTMTLFDEFNRLQVYKETIEI